MNSQILCEVCQAMFKQRLKTGEHHNTLDDYRHAADDGCIVCISAYLNFSSANLPYHENHETIDRLHFSYKFTSDGETTDASDDESDIGVMHYHEPHVLRIFGMLLNEDQEPDRIGLFHSILLMPCRSVTYDAQSLVHLESSLSCPLLSDCASRESLVVSLPPTTTHALDLAATWLKRCEESHSSCTTGFDSLKKPKRLLRCSRDHVRIVETASERVEGPYATLSHRWGSNPDFLVLTASNQESLRIGIPKHGLPQTFQDALEIAQSVGINLLWIDSLCILQKGPGSSEDWNFHAGDMSNVYANCALNIATHNADKPSDGAFAQRKFRLPREPHIWWRGFQQEEVSYTVYSGDLNSHAAIVSSNLSTRGWVFQERLLSPRVLHVTSHQLYWECKETHLASEMYPSGIPDAALQMYGVRPFQVEADTARSRRSHDGHSIEPPFYDSWFYIVKEYSQSVLSFPEKDRLVAILGIARQLSKQRNDNYIAGFFKSDVLWHLTWAATGSSRLSRKVAPTWSWLSVEGFARLPDWTLDDYRLLADVVDLSEEVSNDPHPLSSGDENPFRLVLNALLLPITLFSENGRPSINASLGQNTTRANHSLFLLDDSSRYSSRPKYAIPTAIYMDAPSAPSDRSSLESESEPSPEGTRCLLVELSSAEEETYERIGICTIDNWKADEFQELDSERRHIKLV